MRPLVSADGSVAARSCRPSDRLTSRRFRAFGTGSVPTQREHACRQQRLQAGSRLLRALRSPRRASNDVPYVAIAGRQSRQRRAGGESVDVGVARVFLGPAGADELVDEPGDRFAAVCRELSAVPGGGVVIEVRLVDLRVRLSSAASRRARSVSVPVIPQVLVEPAPVDDRGWRVLCDTASSVPPAPDGVRPETEGFPDGHSRMFEVACTQALAGAVGVRKPLPQSTSRPAEASATSGTMARMARCLSALDGRPRGRLKRRERRETAALALTEKEPWKPRPS